MAVNLVNLESVSKSYGTTSVLEGLSIGVGEGDRIGVVGRNGGGKSTLLRLITGLERPDSGRVTRTGGVHVATVVAARRGGRRRDRARPRRRRRGRARMGRRRRGARGARRAGAGRGRLRLRRSDGCPAASGAGSRWPPHSSQQADLLVLDEPTNHLDVEAITWLADYLNRRRGALLVVTHDRWFLDAVCQPDVGGRRRRRDASSTAATRPTCWPGPNGSRQADASEARRQNLLRKELAWLRRGPPARTSKPRFRIDAAEALIADVPPPRSDDRAALAGAAPARAQRLRPRGRDDHRRLRATLLDDVSWHVGPGDRIGIIGVNGSGKTHLLRLLAGQLDPTRGVFRAGQTVQAGYLSQEVTELPDGLRVIEAVQEVRTTAVLGGVELTASQLAERFGFANNRQWTPVGDLSGGERRRLQLLRLLLAQPNVLLLDEPTNDLDTDTLAALEDLLDSWAGTLVVVSHDRYLIERVCDSTVALIGDGQLAALPGGIDEYLRRRAAGKGNNASPRAAASSAAATDAAPSAAKVDPRAARKELTRLERQIATFDKREATLHAQLATHATDFEKVSALDAELRDVIAAREAAEEAWLQLAE